MSKRAAPEFWLFVWTPKKFLILGWIPGKRLAASKIIPYHRVTGLETHRMHRRLDRPFVLSYVVLAEDSAQTMFWTAYSRPLRGCGARRERY